MTKILHSSDLHGSILSKPFPEDFDIWVDTGDIFPDFVWPPVSHSAKRPQLKWAYEVVPKLIKGLKGRPFVQVPGNHDCVEIVPIFHECGYTNAFRCQPDQYEHPGNSWQIQAVFHDPAIPILVCRRKQGAAFYWTVQDKQELYQN